LKPEAADGMGGGANNPRQAGDAPAAHGDGDPPAGEHPACQMAGPDRAGYKGGRILDLGLNELAADTSNWWQIHRCLTRYHRGVRLIVGRIFDRLSAWLAIASFV